MTLAAIPDIEKVVAYYLRDRIATRVVGKTPASVSDAWIKVTLLSAPGTYPDHLIESLVQFDVYAGATGGQPEANGIAIELRQALGEMAEVAHADAVVTCVTIADQRRVADPDLEPARERVVLVARVYLHAA